MRRASRAIPLLVLVAFLTACVSATPSVQCFKSVQGVAQTVDAAMNVAGDLYRQGKITDAQKAQILDVYGKYQKAAHLAIDGCQIVQDQGSADRLAADVGVAAADVVKLIQSFRSQP